MSSELVLNSNASGVTIALLKDKKLIELHQESTNTNFSVGDVYLGTIKKVMPGLNAAFVDVGHEKDAFLHYLDLGPQVRSLIKYTKSARLGKMQSAALNNFEIDPDIDKAGKIGQVLAKGQQIIVQIVKEPISTKGPRLSSQLSFAGRYVVLVPFSDVISVSKKINSSEERTRLKKLVQSIKPANFGVIIRTVAQERTVEELHKDVQDLFSKWEQIFTQLKIANPPQKLLGEMDRSASMIRDLLNDDFTGIHVNDSFLFEDIKSYVKNISPNLEKIVRLYTGKIPVFEYFAVDKQIKTLFGKEVTLQGGSYLIIEHTEALHVIDVNSGSKTNADNNQEENALNVNMEAATEIARQLRLRDMGGIIVIDFIDLRQAGNRKKVYEKLKDEMSSDRAKHKILPMSMFGLIQITRQRVRPEMNVVTTEVCPMCKGSGQITASILIIDEIENNLKYLVEEMNGKNITLSVHPYIEAFLNKGIYSIKMQWVWKYKRWINIKPVNSYHFSEYHFVDGEGEIIKI